jgi:hypothetical protein
LINQPKNVHVTWRKLTTAELRNLILGERETGAVLVGKQLIECINISEV